MSAAVIPMRERRKGRKSRCQTDDKERQQNTSGMRIQESGHDGCVAMADLGEHEEGKGVRIHEL